MSEATDGAGGAWPEVSAPTLADQVYEAVRDRILDGELDPGEFAREQELSRAMGVSRTPVREALGRLATEGFLERIPHRGYRVPEESLSRLIEVYPIVSALEVLAGRLAFPQVEEDDIEELRTINEELREAMEADDVDAAIDLNNRFHALIAERSGNDHLVELLSELRSQIRRLERWYYSYRDHTEQSVREHASLIHALETGQLERAISIFQGNMAITLHTLREETGLTQENEALADLMESYEMSLKAASGPESR